MHFIIQCANLDEHCSVVYRTNVEANFLECPQQSTEYVATFGGTYGANSVTQAVTSTATGTSTGGATSTATANATAEFTLTLSTTSHSQKSGSCHCSCCQGVNCALKDIGKASTTCSNCGPELCATAFPQNCTNNGTIVAVCMGKGSVLPLYAIVLIAVGGFILLSVLIAIGIWLYRRSQSTPYERLPLKN
jgi:hypothetical protein